MGPLNLEGWVSGEDQYGGLYKIGDDLQRNRQLSELRQHRLQQERDKDEARQASDAQFLTNYLNKKYHLTGTNYDPVKNDLINEAMSQAYKLSSQKVPLPNILQSIGPLVDKVNQYDAKAKMYTENQKQFFDNMKGMKGYRTDEIKKLADEKMFYDTDPQTGKRTLNVDKVDPNYNIYSDIIKENPEKVTDLSGIDDLVNSYKPDIFKEMVKHTNKNGGSEMRKTAVTTMKWMEVNKDGEIQPITEHAKTGDEILKDEKGNPIPVVPKDVFNGILDSEKGASVANYIKGQLKLMGDSTDLKNGQSNLAARHMLWQILKDHTPVHLEDAEDVKANPVDKFYQHYTFALNNPKGEASVPVIKVYQKISDYLTNHTPQNKAAHPLKSRVNGKILMGAAPANGLKGEELDFVIDKAKKYLGSDAGIDDFYINKYGNGDIALVNVRNDIPFHTITKEDADLSANKPLGVQSGRKSVKETQGKQTQSSDKKLSIAERMKLAVGKK